MHGNSLLCPCRMATLSMALLWQRRQRPCCHMHAICLSTLHLRSGIMLGSSAIQGPQRRPPRGPDKHMAAIDESGALLVQCSCELVGDSSAQGRPEVGNRRFDANDSCRQRENF